MGETRLSVFFCFPVVLRVEPLLFVMSAIRKKLGELACGGS